LLGSQLYIRLDNIYMNCMNCMNFLLFCFSSYSGFLEIFQKSPGGVEGPSGNACYYMNVFGLLPKTAWRHELPAKRLNLWHIVSGSFAWSV